jgi:alkylhydroperoxidase/carboxymuconolactone decarboxylase family protein
MKDNYYDPAELKKFGSIRDFQKPLGDKFFEYYQEVFEEGALTKREKSLIALAVAHVIQCPYCIDAYSVGSLEHGADEAQMMEAIHVGAAIRGGAALMHGVQMMERVKDVSM